MNYISPLDALLFARNGTTDVPIAPIAQGLEKIQMKSHKAFNIHEYYDLFQSDQRIFSAATRLRQLFLNQVFVKFSDNSILDMSNKNPLGSVKYSSKQSKESIMSPLGHYTLDEMMRNNDMTTIYGPLTLKVLEAIGWPTRRTQKPLNLERLDSAVEFREENKDFIEAETVQLFSQGRGPI